jgi:hypothetical protein
MIKFIIFGAVLFFVYRLFVKPFLVPPQANAPLDQLQDILNKLQQQQKNPNSNTQPQNKRANDDDYTDYEEIK